MNALIFFLPGLQPIQHLAVALNQRAELCKLGFVVLKKGELLGSHHATAESTGLPHVISAGHGLTHNKPSLYAPDALAMRAVRESPDHQVRCLELTKLCRGFDQEPHNLPCLSQSWVLYDFQSIGWTSGSPALEIRIGLDLPESANGLVCAY